MKKADPEAQSSCTFGHDMGQMCISLPLLGSSRGEMRWYCQGKCGGMQGEPGLGESAGIGKHRGNSRGGVVERWGSYAVSCPLLGGTAGTVGGIARSVSHEGELQEFFVMWGDCKDFITGELWWSFGGSRWSMDKLELKHIKSHQPHLHPGKEQCKAIDN